MSSPLELQTRRTFILVLLVILITLTLTNLVLVAGPAEIQTVGFTLLKRLYHDSFVRIVLVVSVAGAFGGLLASFADVPLAQLRARGWAALGGDNMPLCCAIGMLLGVGGAISFIAIPALDGKFDAGVAEGTLLKFGLLSVASGFVGLALLTKVGNFTLEMIQRETEGMRKNLQEEQTRALKQVNEKAEAATKLTRRKMELVGRLIEALGRDRTHPLFEGAAADSIRQADEYLHDEPGDRQIGILRGRVFQKWKGYESAVDSITEVLRQRDNAGKPKDQDYAALLFNRACYRNRNAEDLEKAGKQTEAENLRAEAYKDVKESCHWDPANTEESKSDKDLTTLWNSSSRPALS